MRMRTIALLLFAVALAAPAAAQGPNTYRSDHGYSVDLPAGWIRAPDAAAEQVSRAAGGLPPGLTMEAVFQAGGAPWPAPPFFAVAWGETPRWLTPEEFRRRWTADDAQAQLQRRANRADTLPTGRMAMRVGQPWWDSDNEAAWMRVGAAATGGVAWNVMMLHPSGRGLIMLLYYGARGADEKEVLAQLDAIVRSLRVD